MMRALLAGVIAVWSMGTAQAAFVLGSNLVANGDAEAGTSNSSGGPVASIPSWTSVSGGMTVVPYNAAGGFPTITGPGPTTRGANFFAGGENYSFSSITQAVSVSDGALLIDSGAVTFNFDAYLGGYINQNDFSTFSVMFESATNMALGSSTIIGPSAAARANQTGLFPFFSTGLIPVGTRILVFELDATRLAGDYDDGYADNLSFVANAAITTVPEPASLTLLGLGVAGVAAVRRRRAGLNSN